MDDNGYDIANYQDIASIFGTMEDGPADRWGQNLVVNHTSDEHVGLSKRVNFKNRNVTTISERPAPRFDVCFSGLAWEDDENSIILLYTFSGKQLDSLENEDSAKNHEMITSGLIRTGGFRMDAIDDWKDLDRYRK